MTEPGFLLPRVLALTCLNPWLCTPRLHSTGSLIAGVSGMQARRNVGPPQTMAWSESQHPARQLQPTPGPQVGGEGDRTNQAGEAAAPSSVAAERKDRLGEQRPRGLEDGSAVQPAAGAAAVEQRNGTESSAGTQNETLDSSASINSTEGGQEVSALSLASE